jgi:hypothetical protein
MGEVLFNYFFEYNINKYYFNKSKIVFNNIHFYLDFYEIICIIYLTQLDEFEKGNIHAISPHKLPIM